MINIGRTYSMNDDDKSILLVLFSKNQQLWLNYANKSSIYDKTVGLFGCFCHCRLVERLNRGFQCFEEASGSVQDHVRGVCSWKNDVPDGSGYRVDISQVSIMIFPMKIKLNCKFGVPYLKTNAKFSSIWLGIEIMMIQYDSYLHRGLCISEFWSGFCVCVNQHCLKVFVG